jgi:hypothetical protein
LCKLCRIAFYAFRISHAQRLAQDQNMSLYYAEINNEIPRQKVIPRQSSYLRTSRPDSGRAEV